MPISGIITPYEKERGLQAIAYLNTHYRNQVSGEQLAEHVNLDIKVLQEIIKDLTTLTIHNYLLKIRLDKATESLEDFRLSIDIIAQKHGFSSSQHFSSLFKKRNQITPRQYRQQLSSNGNHL